MTNPIPPTGAPDTLVERLHDYVSPHDPEWRGRLRPATDDELARYAALSGLGGSLDALPASYRAFARAMGGDSGGLFGGLRLDARIPQIVILYEGYHKFEPDSVNPRLPVVGLYFVGDQISLDLREPAAEPTVVETSDGQWCETLSRSWEALVMQAAVLLVEPRRLPFARWYSHAARPGSGGADLVRATMQAFGAPLGLTEAWPSDSRYIIFLSQELSLFAECFTDGALLFNALSARESLLQKVDDELAPRLKVTRRGNAQIVDGRLQNSP